MLITKHFMHSQIHINGSPFFLLDITGFISHFDFNQHLPQLWVACGKAYTLIQGHQFI